MKEEVIARYHPEKYPQLLTEDGTERMIVRTKDGRTALKKVALPKGVPAKSVVKDAGVNPEVDMGPEREPYSREELEDMTFAELKEVAGGMGIKGRSKTELVDEILAGKDSD